MHFPLFSVFGQNKTYCIALHCIALHCIACVVVFCIGVLGRLDGGQRIVLFPVFDQNKTYCVQCIAVKHIAVLGQRKILHYMCCIVGRAGWTGGQRRRRQW